MAYLKRDVVTVNMMWLVSNLIYLIIKNNSDCGQQAIKLTCLLRIIQALEQKVDTIFKTVTLFNLTVK